MLQGEGYQGYLKCFNLEIMNVIKNFKDQKVIYIYIKTSKITHTSARCDTVFYTCCS